MPPMKREPSCWPSRVLLLISLLFWKGGCQEVILEVIKPESQAICFNMPVEYQCRIVERTSNLEWKHSNVPSGTLSFIASNSVGDERSSDDGVFSANLTDSSGEEGAATLSSVLTILPDLSDLNGTLLSCVGFLSEVVSASTTITLSGSPDSPWNLSQDTSANTESSAVIQWQTPLFTGGDGISVVRYNVVGTDIGLDFNTSDVVTYNITGINYNTDYNIEVVAINSCDQESLPSNLLVNIEARVPPTPMVPLPVLSCDVPLKDGRPVLINWMYGVQEEDVVYPGEVAVSVELDPGDIVCSGVTADDTNCTANITRDDDYTVNVTVTNDVGSSQALNTFNTAPLQLEEILDSESSLSITVSLNRICRSSVSYGVRVSFGRLMEAQSQDCPEDLMISPKNVEPGGSGVTFTVNTTTLSLGSGQQYCYTVQLNNEIVIMGRAGSGNDPPSDTTFPIGGIVGIVVGVVVTVIIIIAIILVAVYMTKKTKPDDPELKMKVLSSTSGNVSPVAKDPPAPPSNPAPMESSVDAGPMYQDPNTITHTPHPETGELYADVQIDKSKKKKKKGQHTDGKDAGPMYQDPNTIQHQQTEGGDLYAMPQKKKSKKGREGEKELTEEEKAALYSQPDRKTQKAKSEGLMYAELDMHSSSKPPQLSQHSFYAAVQHQD